MLDIDSATDYFLSHGLLQADAIIEGAVAITSSPRRNRNLRVEVGDSGFFFKQPGDPAHGGHHTLRCEMDFYAYCQRADIAAVHDILPRVVYCAPDESAFALELYRDGVSLWDSYRLHAGPAFPFDVPAALGRALGAAHAAFDLTRCPAREQLPWLHDRTPWVLAIHQPAPEVLASISAANYQILRILQSEEKIGGQLDDLGRFWQPTTVIHGDVKSDNVLVSCTPAGAPRVRLVDWEMAQIGDPAWDLAGALQDFILFWLQSMPLGAGLSAEQIVAAAGCPLAVLRAAVREMWFGYVQTRGLSATEANALAGRAVAFSAARLIQSAYEASQDASALPAYAALLLQISANVLAAPEAAQVELYGIASAPVFA